MKLIARLLAPALLLATIAPVLAADNPAATAKDLITKVTSESIAILRDKNLSKDQKNEKIQKIAEASMDFDTTARMALGPGWRTLSDQKKKEYSEEFKKRLMISYSHTTDEYTDEDIAVTKSRQESNGDFTVETLITDPTQGKKEVAKVDYRLRARNGPMKIIDVTIDGVSIITNYRSQFQDIMANGGIEKLLKLLRDKNARNEK
jgi:phospholipid transport system substrate-binding protein